MNPQPARAGRSSARRARGRSIIPRERLVSGLTQSDESAIVLICAPAGFGKSTVLAEWEHADPRPFAWLTLAARHDDPVLLTESIAGALAELAPVGENVYLALNGSKEGALNVAVPRLLESLHHGDAPLVLALDDVQEVSDPDSLSIISAIARGLPEGSQLALASRTEPAIRLGRSRANRNLIELDAGDLAMTRRETDAMLRACGLSLDPKSVDVLRERTEGWPAALYLAALSLGEAADPDADARRFAGDDRLVVDYLRDEFIDNLDQEDASFLARTSILNELSGDLCDAVLDSEGSASTLRDLARSNALVKSLDSKDHSFKYHALLRDMLVAELRRVHPREELGLRGRAAGWYAERGDYDSAVPHAVASGDTEAAASLIWSQAGTYTSTGRVTTVKRWLNLFYEAQIANSPMLCLARATTELGSGNGAEVVHWTARARANLDDRPRQDAEAIRVAAGAIEACGVAREGVISMRTRAAEAFALMEAEDPWRSSCRLVEGASLHLTGEPALAREALEDAARRGIVVAPGINTVALAQLALLALDEDDLIEARRLSMESIKRFRLNALIDQPTQALVPAVAGFVEAQRGDPTSAGRDIKRAVSLLSRLNDFSPWLRTETRIVIARALVRLDDVPAARRQIANASRELRLTPDAPLLAQWLATAQEEADAATMGGRSPLTKMELKVLQYLPGHLSFPRIAEELFLSLNTVKTHVRAIYMKLDVSSRAEAVIRARQAGLLGEGGDPSPPSHEL